MDRMDLLGIAKAFRRGKWLRLEFETTKIQRTCERQH